MSASPSVRHAATSGRRLTRPLTWILVLLLVAGLAVAGMWYWRTRATEAAAAPSVPTTATISLEPYRVTVAGPGSLEAARSLAVTSEAAGTVIEIVGVGERVTQGQIVARMDPTPFERAVRDAEFALEKAQVQLASLDANQADSSGNLRQSIAEAGQRVTNAQREVQRTQEELQLTTHLHELGTESAAAVQVAQDGFDTSVAELSSAQAALARLQESQGLQDTSAAQERRNTELAVSQAQLALEDAQADLDAITVSAPFDGVVSGVTTGEGAFVAEEGALLTLIGDSTLSLPVQIDETQILDVALGQTATVSLDAISDETFAGTVTAISPVAQIESNIPIFYVTVTLDNPELRLRPGMTAEADIVVEEFESTATVPLGAVQMAPNRPTAGAAPAGRAGPESARGGSIVMVRGADGAFEPRSVTLVDSIGFEAVVQGDLAEGDVIRVSDVGPSTGTPAARNDGPGGGVGGFPGVGIPGAGGPSGGRFQ
jgi:HlyD family secretion protein